jgi:hypothetical protein
LLDINTQERKTTMAKNVNNKTSKAPSSGKSGLKSQIKTSRVASTKLGVTPPGVSGRLALNHNETFLK